LERPKIITIWALVLGVAAVFDLWSAVRSYAINQLDFRELNPGPLAVFRPIAWAVAVMLPIGLWFMRRWAVVLYPILQIAAVAVTYWAQPSWLSAYPGWAIPLTLSLPVLFLLTLMPHWKAMGSRLP
jgi:hypothetical protein